MKYPLEEAPIFEDFEVPYLAFSDKGHTSLPSAPPQLLTEAGKFEAYTSVG